MIPQLFYTINAKKILTVSQNDDRIYIIEY